MATCCGEATRDSFPTIHCASALPRGANALTKRKAALNVRHNPQRNLRHATAWRERILAADGSSCAERPALMQVAGGVDMKAVGGSSSAPGVRVVNKSVCKAGVALPSFVAAVGLMLLALPASQPAHAFDAISLAGVNKAFQTAGPAVATKTSMKNDSAIAALREYAQGLSSNEAANAADDY